MDGGDGRGVAPRALRRIALSVLVHLVGEVLYLCHGRLLPMFWLHCDCALMESVCQGVVTTGERTSHRDRTRRGRTPGGRCPRCWCSPGPTPTGWGRSPRWQRR